MASRALQIDPKASKQELTTAVGAGQAEPAQSLNPEEIAARSYELWHERGCPIGSPEVDWFRAEDELRDRHSRTQSGA
jgi:hypothetical protein